MRLLWSPLALPEVAAASPLWVGVVVGVLSLWWLLGSWSVLLGASMDGPWGDWSHAVLGVLRVSPFCGLMPLVLVGMAVALVAGPVSISAPGSVARAQANVALLSFVPFLVPASTWLAAVGLVELSGQVMDDDVLDLLAASWSMQVASSCSWLMLGVALWLTLLILSLLRVKAYVRSRQGLCARCGYDLRGSLAADSTACPECGEAIPESLRGPLLRPSISDAPVRA